MGRTTGQHGADTSAARNRISIPCRFDNDQRGVFGFAVSYLGEVAAYVAKSLLHTGAHAGGDTTRITSVLQYLSHRDQSPAPQTRLTLPPVNPPAHAAIGTRTDHRWYGP